MKAEEIFNYPLTRILFYYNYSYLYYKWKSRSMLVKRVWNRSFKNSEVILAAILIR